MLDPLTILLIAGLFGAVCWWQRRVARSHRVPPPPAPRRQPCLRRLPHYVPAWGLISEDGGHVGRMPGNPPYRRQVEEAGAYEERDDAE